MPQIFASPSFSKKIIKGIIVLSLGLLAVIYPGLTSEALLKTIGSLIIAYTVISSVISYIAMRRSNVSRFWQFQGVFGLLVGLALVFYPNSVIDFVITFLGIILFFVGFAQFFASIQSKMLGSISWGAMIISLLIVTGSVVMVSKPDVVAEKFVLFFGIMAIFSAISEIIMAFKIRKRQPTNTTNSGNTIVDVDYEEVE